MVEVGFLTAFIGGALALLTPCSALLLPAFFSATVASTHKIHLLVHGLVFFVGLLVTLVPLGLGFGALGGIIHDQWSLLVIIASVLLIVMGVMQLLGAGFDLSRMVPGFRRLERTTMRSTGVVKTLLLGASSGVAGFCAGPILGAILTLALTMDSMWRAGLLLGTYGAGMVVPLLLIALLWDTISESMRARLRGRATTIVAGVLLIAVGIIFWVTDGLVAAPQLVPMSVLTDVQNWVSAHAVSIQLIAVVVMAAALLLWWHFRYNQPPRSVRIDIPTQPEILKQRKQQNEH